MKTGSLVNFKLSNMSLKINLQIINIKKIKLKDVSIIHKLIPDILITQLKLIHKFRFP